MTDTSPPTPPAPFALLPILLLFMIGALWGGFFALIKFAVTGGVEPVSYLFWFTLLSGSFLFAAATLRGRRPAYQRAHLPYYMKLGLVRFTLANMILYTVQGKLPVGIMAVIMTFVPIFTYLISLIVRIEKFFWLRSLGIVLGFAGGAADRGAEIEPARSGTRRLGADRVRRAAAARGGLCHAIRKIASAGRRFHDAVQRHPVRRRVLRPAAGAGARRFAVSRLAPDRCRACPADPLRARSHQFLRDLRADPDRPARPI